MDKLKTAKEIGLRCRRFRNALGLSQDALGEKVGILGATISKYEREGIYDIEKIQELSQALGHDLLMDEIDQEGIVGEIGKEILYILVLNNGYISFDYLVRNKMYGMTTDRITNEVFKLERIGMCVREQYNDWWDEEADKIFITAKGIITLKNMQLNDTLARDLYDKLPYVRSYECIINGFDSYQQYIEKNDLERLVRSIDYFEGLEYFFRDDEMKNKRKEDGTLMFFKRNDFFSTCHRINYVKYLKDNYESFVDNDADFRTINGLEVVTGKNIYHDILFRMSLNLTNQIIYDEILCGGYSELKDNIQYIKDYIFDDDPVVEASKKFFIQEFDINENDQHDMALNDLKKMAEAILKRLDELTEEFFGMTYNEFFGTDLDDMPEKIPSETFELYKEQIEDILSCSDYITNALEHKQSMDSIFLENISINTNRPEGASLYPIDWFTDEEIREFINENFGPAKTEEDRRLDAILHQINELCPESLDYYDFPQSWEENGLANLIRENCGLEIPSDDEDDFDSDDE